MLLFSISASAETWQFTTCGESGPTGPSSCNYDYVTLEDGWQFFEVPTSGTYRIQAEGAEGNEGGDGAMMEAEDVSLDEGDMLRILVGQEGTNPSDSGQSGSGGSFILNEVSSGDTMWDGQDVDPILMAGGGGAGSTGTFGSDAEGQTGECGGDEPDGGDGGCGGSGGESTSGSAGGGAGYFEDGGEDRGGEAILDGGTGTSGAGGTEGGFGGGGGSSNLDERRGGAGGYSGGAGGQSDQYAGGGGSFAANSVDLVSSSRGFNSGPGSAEIELLTSPDDPDITNVDISKTSASSTSNPAEIDFTVDVDIDDEGGVADDNELTSCSASADGNNINTNIDDDGSGGGTAECSFTIENDEDNSWEPGETISVDIDVEDDYGGSGSTTESNLDFPNSDPETVDVSVVDDHVRSDYDGEVWGGENGVTMEVDVTDYESASTNTDVDVELDGGSIDSGTVSNGEGTFTTDWENGGEDMDGFDRGESYGVDATAFDETGSSSSSSTSFTVLREASVSDPSPVDGDSAEELEVSIDDNPAVDVDDDLSDFDVEFWVRDGVDFELEDTDTISGTSGTASINIEDLELENPPGEWKFIIDDTYSRTDYEEEPYNENTDPNSPYEFVTAEPPEILSDDPSSRPIDETGVELNPDLEILIDDPDDSEVEVTFYEGDVGSEELGADVVEDGSGIASLTDHSFAESPGTEYEWSVRAEDTEFDEVNESDTFGFTTVEEPEINFENPANDGVEEVEVEPELEAEIVQSDDYDIIYGLAVEKEDEVEFDTSGSVSDTESGEVASFEPELEPGATYNFTVDLELDDYDVEVSDELEFTTGEMPELVDFGPEDSEEGLENPVLEVGFDNPNSGDTEVRFYDWEDDELLGSGVVSGSEAEFDSSEVDGFGDQAGEDYFWYVEIVDEDTGATYNTEDEDGEWKFSTSDVLDADVTVEEGDGQNMNPGTAEVGPEELELNVSNEEGLDMDEAVFELEDEVFAEVGSVNESELFSVNVSGEVDENERYDWRVTVFEDDNEIAEFSGEFTTYVVTADWVDEAVSDAPATHFNLYHTSEGPQEPFAFGEGDYDVVASTDNVEIDLAFAELGTGEDDCFRVTAENSAGESDEHPLDGDDAECVDLGGEE